MLRVLLAKDLRRVWRNPLPWLVNLIIPLCVTALIGFAFGGKPNSGLERLKFAVVNEDRAMLSDLLRNAASQPEAGGRLEPVFVNRETALRQINDNEVSAAVVIRTNFARDYFAGRSVSLELIKNPAQSIQPTTMEELLGALVTGMNAVAHNFSAVFPEWQSALEGEMDFRTMMTLMNHTSARFQAAKKYISPPLVSYEKEAPVSAPKAKPNNGLAGIFSWVLVGMCAMFLLFLAGNAMTDLQRELRFRTFERYQTMHERLLPFVGGKVIFGVVFLALCSTVMIGGGGLIFHIHWVEPMALATMAFSYACFAASLMAALVAWSPDERHSGTLNSIVAMILGMAGGCMFPVRQLPAFIRDHITPLMPSHWFVDTARNLQGGATDVPWVFVSLKLITLSVVLTALAVVLFQRRFKSGLRT